MRAARASGLVVFVVFLASTMHSRAGSASDVDVDVADPYFGEALYHAYQERYFEALERMDTEIAQHHGLDEPALDSFYAHIDEAEFSVGDFELNYRMHHRAGRAIRAVLEGDVDESVRNEAAFRLARIHFQKDQPADALRALDGIDGRIPEDIRDDIDFLRANVFMAMGRAAEAADVLGSMNSSRDLHGFSAYNLGIALLQAGRQKEAIQQLERAGRVSGRDPGTLAIRDKSNLALGTLLIDASEPEAARRYLDRVRLSGPLSNQALLRAGWTDLSVERFERALAPWGILAKREATDPAVQEAMLALPYAYSKLNVHGRAAVLYERAVQSFGSQLERVDASIGSIRNGAFLEALVREEIRQDKDWVIRLRMLPETPETFYLMTLMASHDFQTALQNYLDLEDLRKRLVAWQTSFDAFDDIIRLRREYYKPLLPGIDRRFRKLDAQTRLRLEQREHLAARLQQMLIAPRPDHLATTAERIAATTIDRLEAALPEQGNSELQARIRRLRGVLHWRIETRYHERLTDAHEHLRDLDEHVAALTAQYDSFVRARQAAAHSYVGYEIPIDGLRMRVKLGLDRLNLLMARQGHMLETVAIAELSRRRDRLEAYQNQARFAFADSYDRAAKAQAQ